MEAYLHTQKHPVQHYHLAPPETICLLQVEIAYQIIEMIHQHDLPVIVSMSTGRHISTQMIMLLKDLPENDLLVLHVRRVVGMSHYAVTVVVLTVHVPNTY
jgi:hypothetical protein